MPIFKMKCLDCGTVFEALFKTSSAVVHCAGCGGSSLEKLPSEIAVLDDNNSCPNKNLCGANAPCCCSGNCGGIR